jgi:enoyl-CoA hydratase
MYQSLSISAPSASGVVGLELRRAADRNAFDETLHREFSEALAELRGRADLRVILLHSQGPVFSAGGNFDYLRQIRADEALQRRTQREGYDIFTLLNDLPYPIVAAVQGHAMGLGATIVTACDVIVAYKDAKIGDPHVQAGLVAGDGGAISWSAAAGMTRAKRQLLTGQPLTAAQAFEFGLVTDLVDSPQEAYPAALAIAEQIAALPPMAVQGTKRAFNVLAKQRLAGALEVSLLAELATIRSEDVLEALAAIAEKRRGQFHNR